MRKRATFVMQYYCFICKESITEAEYNYSKDLFNMALCRTHQDIQRKIAQERQAETEEKTNSKKPEPKTASIVNIKQLENPVQKKPIPNKHEDALIQWLIQWAAARPINLALESKHFFLEGMRLEEFARDAIGKAKDEILVTNPYVDSCFLSTALYEARDRRVNVKIVTRRPKKDKEDMSKLECQAYLRKKGITVHYINTIHSKIIVIDRKIALISSMNLYSASAGGGSLEAGIVSFDDKVVDSAAKYTVDLLEKSESPDITSFSNSKYWRR